MSVVATATAAGAGAGAVSVLSASLTGGGGAGGAGVGAGGAVTTESLPSTTPTVPNAEPPWPKPAYDDGNAVKLGALG